jgi:hypothetical protein
MGGWPSFGGPHPASMTFLLAAVNEVAAILATSGLPYGTARAKKPVSLSPKVGSSFLGPE